MTSGPQSSLGRSLVVMDMDFRRGSFHSKTTTNLTRAVYETVEISFITSRRCRKDKGEGTHHMLSYK